MSNSVQPHRRQPTRLPHPWDSPGKNNGVGCHFLLQCMKVKSESEVPQSYPTLSDPMDCSLPGSSVYGIFQARVLKWGAIAFSSLYQIRSVSQWYLTLCNPMNCSKPGLHVHHQLPEFTQTHVHWEKAMAPHSSTLAWKIPWAEEPGGLQSVGSRRVGHD